MVTVKSKDCCGSSLNKDCGGSSCDEQCIRKIATIRCYADTTHGLCNVNAGVAQSPSKGQSCCKEGAKSTECTPIKTKQNADCKVASRNACQKDTAFAPVSECRSVSQSTCVKSLPAQGEAGTSKSSACCNGEQQASKVVSGKERASIEGGCCSKNARTNVGCGGNEENQQRISGATLEKSSCCKAETACAEGEPMADVEKKPSCCAEEPAGIACADHLQKTFDELSGMLGKGLCICRTVLARLPGSCSSVPSPSASLRSVSRESVPDKAGSCCKPKSSGAKSKSGRADHQIASCCTGRPQSITAMDASKDSCCAARVVRSDLSKPDTFAACKTTGDSTASTEKLRTKGKIDDIERGAAKQHVLLNISGMTCTGCVRKVMNVLGGVSGISAPKVTFVSGVAEFDIASNTNLRSVINELEKGTGFSCSQIVSKFQSLDLISAVALPMTNKAELPDGIESIERLDKHTYRVNYDPVIVGARSLRSTFEGATLAPPSNDAMLREGKKRLVNMGWSTVVSAALTIPIVVLSWSDNPVPEDTRLIVSLVLGTLVQGIAIPEFYVGAIKSLIYSRMIEMDMLVVISITAAYGYSVVAFALHFAGVTLVEEAFFETSALLITLVLLGRFMAALARIRAVSAVSVRSLQAEKAHVIQPSGDSVEMDARLLQFGDVFMVLPHALIPTDGDVVAGTSSVDESMITGESVPVPKGKGDGLIAGTINGPGTMKVKLTRLPGKNSITDIANMVENALGAKPRIQDLADKVASWFIPSVIALATIVLAIWIAVGLRVRKLDGGDSFGVAITYSIAVLAVSCPCALGLAVPMVLVIAGGVTARQGVIVKSADAIERGHKITDVIFDKTGTLTKGDLVVVHTAMFAAPDSTLPERAVLGAIHALTKNNDHPVSRAVAESTKLRSSTSVEITNIESVPGAGVKAMFMGCTIKAGNPYWLELDHHPDISALIDHGMTLLCVTANEELVAVFGLKSNLRPEAADVIRKLKSRNLACHIVSGDGPQVVRNVADSVGVPFSTAMSRHKPAEKQAYVQSLMDDGKVVLFCGDGTNDAIAVAQANVGVQIGNASDVTKATADVVLLGGLDGILVLLDVSKRSFRRIVFNFVWSAVYNVFAILLAAGAFVRVRIPPAYAGLGEIVSVLPVILAAMTLSRTKTKASSA